MDDGLSSFSALSERILLREIWGYLGTIVLFFHALTVFHDQFLVLIFLRHMYVRVRGNQQGITHLVEDLVN